MVLGEAQEVRGEVGGQAKALPTTAIVHPSRLYGALAREVEDLRYAEFTHNWSGVFVCLLGLCWLLQGFEGRKRSIAGTLWPLLLLPFAAFVAITSDPEVWWLRKVPFLRVLSDPQLLEH